MDFEEFVLHLWDSPTNEVKMAGGTIRKKPDPEGFVEVLGHFPLDYCAIENVHSMPHDGHVGAFTFGKVTGVAIGVAHGLRVPLKHVTPAKWKHEMQVPAAKDAAKFRASQLFPQCTLMWARAGDHGRAEAAVIALHTAIVLGLKPTRPFQMGLVNFETPKPKRSHK